MNPDGTPNQARLNQNLVAAGPQAALAAQDSAQKGQTLDQDTFVTHMARLTSLSGAAMGLAAQYPNGVPQDAVNREIDQQAAKLGLSPADIARAKSQFGADPAANTAAIFRNHAANLTAQQALMATRPGSATIDTGQSTTGATVGAPLSAHPGALTPTGPVTTTGLPSRTTLGGQAKWTTTDGVEHQGTWEQYAKDRNAGLTTQDPLLVPPAAATPQTPAGVPPPGTVPTTQGEGVKAGRVRPEPGSPLLKPAPAATPTFTDTPGPAPGAVEATRQTAEQQAALGTALVARADQVPTNRGNYGNMLSDLKRLDTMGPGTERETYANALAAKLTGYGITMTPDQIAGSQSFQKISSMIAAAQLSTLGATDSRQALAIGANPHLDLSKLGNEQIIHMLQGTEDAIEAKGRAWQTWSKQNGSGSYGQFADDFNRNFDVRVFQQQYMQPKEIEQLRAGMTGPGEAAKFRHDVQFARDNGWIKTPAKPAAIPASGGPRADLSPPAQRNLLALA